jgi:hypothetical protein
MHYRLCLVVALLSSAVSAQPIPAPGVPQFPLMPSPPVVPASPATGPVVPPPPALQPQPLGTPTLPPLAPNGSDRPPPQLARPPLAERMPSRVDSASDAFRRLDSTNRGYVTRADAARVPGFMAFEQADKDGDGVLSWDEFREAWKYYGR